MIIRRAGGPREVKAMFPTFRPRKRTKQDRRKGGYRRGGGVVRRRPKIDRFRIFRKLEVNSQIENISDECKNYSTQVHCLMLQMQLFVD